MASMTPMAIMAIMAIMDTMATMAIMTTMAITITIHGGLLEMFIITSCNQSLAGLGQMLYFRCTFFISVRFSNYRE